VYRKIGGHAYGWVYSGPIGALVTPQLAGLARARELPFASSLCAACREVCPVKINIPDLLLHLRSKAQDETQAPPKPKDSPVTERTTMRVFAWAMKRPWAYSLGGRLARLARYRSAVAEMSNYAVQSRYPDDLVELTRDDVVRSLKIAEEALASVKERLSRARTA